jgi:hypothetical protein
VVLSRPTGIGPAGLALSWLVFSAFPESAAAIEPPSGTALDELRARSYHELRVVGSFGARTMREPIVSEQGITETRPPSMTRVAVIETPGAHPKDPPPLVPWSEISEVQNQQPAYKAGLIVGVASGLLAGLAVLPALVSESSDAAGNISEVAILTGLTTGLLTTVLFRDWKRIYPKKS